MRQVVVDTETTGLNPSSGDRIVEIACVELIDSRISGEEFHYYLNPEMPMPAAALEVHGLKDDFLADKPCFSEIARQLATFLQDAELIIHNAPFDLAFLNAELLRCKHLPIESLCAGVTDTLRIARKHQTTKRNSLDDLCITFGVATSSRGHHGALEDARNLADIYVEMRRRWGLAIDA